MELWVKDELRVWARWADGLWTLWHCMVMQLLSFHHSCWLTKWARLKSTEDEINSILTVSLAFSLTTFILAQVKLGFLGSLWWTKLSAVSEWPTDILITNIVSLFKLNPLLNFCSLYFLKVQLSSSQSLRRILSIIPLAKCVYKTKMFDVLHWISE